MIQKKNQIWVFALSKQNITSNRHCASWRWLSDADDISRYRPEPSIRVVLMRGALSSSCYISVHSEIKSSKMKERGWKMTHQHEWWHTAPAEAAPGPTSHRLWASTASQGEVQSTLTVILAPPSHPTSSSFSCHSPLTHKCPFLWIKKY